VARFHCLQGAAEKWLGALAGLRVSGFARSVSRFVYAGPGPNPRRRHNTVVGDSAVWVSSVHLFSNPCQRRGQGLIGGNLDVGRQSDALDPAAAVGVVVGDRQEDLQAVG
jgi:hypothetical protein